MSTEKRGQTQPPNQPHVFDFYPLEDRVLLSGEGVDGPDASIDAEQAITASLLLGDVSPEGEGIDTSTSEVSSEAKPAGNDPQSPTVIYDVADAPTLDPALPIEVIFVDAGVDDAETLIEGLRVGGDQQVQWVVIDLVATEDGVEQITEALSQLSSVDAVHLLSHGDGDGIQLGNTRLDIGTAASYAGDIASWASAMDADADLLIYGCDLASTSDGRALIDSIGALCDCDVAASDDITGHDSLGGDWILEYAVGDVSTEVAFSFIAQSNWNGALDISTDLVSHHTFDTDATDSVGSNDGTLAGDASIDTINATNQVGAGNLSLDGTGDYVDLSTHVSAYAGLTEGTIAAWVRLSASGENTIFGLSDDGDVSSLLKFSIDAGQLKWTNLNDAGDNVVAFSTATINDDLWHHVAVTVDATGNKLYIDGVQASVSYSSGAATNSQFANDITVTDEASIGRSVQNNTVQAEFNGQIDDHRVYSRSLSSTDIAELYADTALNVHTTNDIVDGTTTDVASLLNDRGADGLISLREAILAVNNDASTDWTINLGSGTYSFASGVGDSAGDFDIRNSVTIVGDGIGNTIIDANQNDRVLEVHAGTVTFQDLTIQDGFGSSVGSGIDVNSGTDVTLDHVRLFNNQITTSQGGAIYNAGTLTVLDSEFDTNVSVTANAGGIRNLGDLTIERTIFTNNSTGDGLGGAIY